MKKILKFGSIALIFIFIIWLVLLANIYIQSFSNDKENVDAVVVPGASQWNGRPSPAFRSRLDRAISIYKSGFTKYIILTGGIAQGDTLSESSVGKRYLVKKGIPNSNILIEEKGTTTLESLTEVSNILSKKNIDSVLFVSHGYHIYRVKMMARDLDISNSHASAVSIKDNKKKVKLIVKESFIYIYYLFNNGYKEILIARK